MIRRVVCGMSGGVDSAVSALLLKKRGFQVVGAFMKNWDLRDEVGHCSSQADLEDAQHVCEHLEISLHQVDFVKEYWTHVFTPMIQEYEQGLTPNPDVQCNRHIKFGYFHEYCMKQLGADAVATGHYARNSLGNFLEYYKPDAEAKLLVPKDQVKDQTLFLCQIQQSALRRTMFPVGDLLKTQVKEIAKEIGLQRISGKKESMGICFIGSRYFHDFIEEYIEPKCGKFINIDTGKVMGEHKGVHYWTIGQRCQIGGLAKACFVVNMESTTNDILVAEGTHHPALYTDRLFIKEPYWIGSSSAQQQLDNEGVVRCRFRFQNLHSLMECTLHRQTDYFEVKLEHPLRAITAGQYAVFYEDDTCIGSSSILRPGPSLHDQGIQLDELTARAFRRTYART